jgi:hypothetical protein
VNLAFPTLVLLTLAFPGILFRYYYRRGIDSTPFHFKDLGEEIFFGFLAAVSIHAILMPYFLWATKEPAPMTEVLLFLAGPNAAPAIESFNAIKKVADNAVPLLYYFAISSMIGALSGFALYRLVEYRHWDIRGSFFIFANPWKRILTGRGFVIPHLKEKGIVNPTRKQVSQILDRIVIKLVSGIVEIEGVAHLYNGILEGYELNNEGELDRLILYGAYRFPLPKQWSEGLETIFRDPPNPAQNEIGYFPITGDKFILQYRNVKTLNLRFYLIAEEPQSSQQISGS